jgi:ABC-type multidrug transport system fused ATPase/permease subunit
LIAGAPVNALLTETIAGMSTICAYEQEAYFIRLLEKRIEDRFIPWFIHYSASYWLTLRIGLFNVTTTLTILLATYFGLVNVENFGLAITNTAMISIMLGLLFESLAGFEASFSAVERLKYYITDLPHEAPHNLETDPSEMNWPSRGQLNFQNLEFAYESTPDTNVLNNVTFTVNSGEHVGIVGRTGAGKSTLVSSIFRITEPKGGKILIDGHGILNLIKISEF